MAKKITVASLRKDLREDLRGARVAFASKMDALEKGERDIALANFVAGTHGVAYAFVSSYSGVNATIRLSVSSMKKDRRLRNMLTRAIDKDLMPVETEDYVTEWRAERSFAFIMPDGGRLTIEARLKEDGETCRKVQVGVETVERPKYALECN